MLVMSSLLRTTADSSLDVSLIVLSKRPALKSKGGGGGGGGGGRTVSPMDESVGPPPSPFDALYKLGKVLGCGNFGEVIFFSLFFF